MALPILVSLDEGSSEKSPIYVQAVNVEGSGLTGAETVISTISDTLSPYFQQMVGLLTEIKTSLIEKEPEPDTRAEEAENRSEEDFQTTESAFDSFNEKKLFGFLSPISNFFKGIAAFFRKMIATAPILISSLYLAFKNFIDNIRERGMGVFEAIVNSLWQAVTNLVDFIIDGVLGVIAWVAERMGFGEVAAKIRELADFINITQWVTDFRDAMVDFLVYLFTTDIKTIFKDFVNLVRDGLGVVWVGFKKLMIGIADLIPGLGDIVAKNLLSPDEYKIWKDKESREARRRKIEEIDLEKSQLGSTASKMDQGKQFTDQARGGNVVGVPLESAIAEAEKNYLAETFNPKLKDIQQKWSSGDYEGAIKSAEDLSSLRSAEDIAIRQIIEELGYTGDTQEIRSKLKSRFGARYSGAIQQMGYNLRSIQQLQQTNDSTDSLRSTAQSLPGVSEDYSFLGSKTQAMIDSVSPSQPTSGDSKSGNVNFVTQNNVANTNQNRTVVLPGSTLPDRYPHGPWLSQ